MSTVAPPQPATYMADASIAKFSVARYQQMIDSGVLTSEDKVELLENYVVLKMPRNPQHDGTIDLIDETLTTYVPKGWRVRCQLTVVLSDSQPEPDFAIARGDGRSYITRHPTPPDVGLVIEVANTSLLRDQRDKARIYARANIFCYWIVNLEDRRIEVHTQPSGPCDSPAYASVVNYSSGESVPLVLDGATVAMIPVAELLP
ncbi:MAG TPA: Uma2 family endonuclease [Gemmata sp.]|nr:Uma2 family endonuclease [Gemmata sp.]